MHRALSAALVLILASSCSPPPANLAGVEAAADAEVAAAQTEALPPPPAPPRAASLRFVETFPVETTLDDPELPEAFEVWPELIAGAETSLDISEFYISNDPDGDSRLNATLDAITAAADRGVAVRIIGDAKFYKTYPQWLDGFGEHDNIDVRIYDMKPHTGGVQHAKYFIVDDRVAYVGSQNMDWRSLEHIQELGFQVGGAPFVDLYADIFDLDWALAGGATLEEAVAAADLGSTEPFIVDYEGQAVTARPVVSPASLTLDEALWDLPHLLKAIEGADSKIRVQLMSYAVKGYDKSEWRDLDGMLRGAAERGVQVELLVANWSKRGSKLAELQDLQRVDNITVKFANIPEWSGGFVPFSRVIHSKLMLVDDDWAWVGTSNWSKDYFYGSRNVGIIVEGAGPAEDLWRFSDRVWNSEYTEVVDPDKTDYRAPKTR